MADVNLNLGSYGAAPKVVLDAVQAIHAETEARPDIFMRRSCLPKLNDVKKRVAELIGADEHECVIVPNATHGINTITSAIDWVDGDVIVICQCLIWVDRARTDKRTVPPMGRWDRRSNTSVIETQASRLRTSA